MQETQVQSLGWDDPLEKEKGTPLQYSCLENPMEGGAWWATVHGVAKSRTRLKRLSSSSSSSRAYHGEGNGDPHQYSSLENLMDRGAWRATVHGVTKSQTGLKRLSMAWHGKAYPHQREAS